jgi:single-strand DNA-binding protein
MFKIEVIGNLGADAEVKVDNGRQYCQFSVADTRKFKNADGTDTEVTTWVSCFMRNTEAEVIKYLKKGTKVFVRGNGDLRVFSSAKDRMMKAGASVNVSEIELVGGSSDDVPRRLALANGQLLDVQKLYRVNLTGIEPKPTEIADLQGVLYNVDTNGFVSKKSDEPF